jgi:glycosyltransferase involved in cell wall biosynthesis
MTTRALFVQPYLATYRVAFYRQLAEALAPDGLRVEVAVGIAQPARADVGDWPATLWPDEVGRWTHDRMRFRRGRVNRRDLVVVEQAIRNVDSWMMLARPSRLRPAVAVWGHGRPPAHSGWVSQRMKRGLTNRADWFFGYTQSSVDHAISHGFPLSRTTVVGNTIDTVGLEADLAAVSDSDLRAFRSAHGLTPGATALFLGGVDDAKDIDFVISAAVAAAGLLEGFTLLVAGAGTRLDDIREAQAAGVPIRVIGRVDRVSKAQVLRAADVLMIPRGVGLVAVDSLVAGVPIVTIAGRDHGPEEEYLSDDQCVRVTPDASAAYYAAQTVRLMREVDELAAMADACRQRARPLRLNDMVERFREGLLALRDIHEHGL